MELFENRDPDRKLGDDFEENARLLKEMFRNCSDVTFRDITFRDETKLLFIYTEGMVNKEVINAYVLKPLMYDGLPDDRERIGSIAQLRGQGLFTVLQSMKINGFNGIADHVLRGHAALLIEGETAAYLIDVGDLESRAIEESANEATLRGARESFTEQLRTNVTLLRRILTTPMLKIEFRHIGKLTNTEVAIAYLEGKASVSVLDEIRSRVDRIRLDGILESGYIEESIEDTHISPFPQMMNTERPDVVAAALLEGKVAIMTDGSPNMLIIPMTFWDGLQAPDDYYERFLYVSLNRWIRYLFAAFSLFFPSIYIALTTFHPEMVPPKLMLSITGLRERAPFPTAIEVFIMEFMFEGLREAGIRLPRQIGPLVSIVGALVIGEAAVRAGIISAPIVIVVSAAGISSFVIPRYRFSFPLRMLRFPILILSGMFGLFGIAIGIIVIIVHLIHLSPFGMPYLTPVTPLVSRRLKDVFMRAPRKLTKRSRPERGTGSA